MPLIRLAWARLQRPHPRQLLARFGPQLRDRREVESRGNALFGQPLLPGDLDLLPGDVAGVFHVVCRPARLPSGEHGASAGSRATNVGPSDLRPARATCASVASPNARCVEQFQRSRRSPLLLRPTAASAAGSTSPSCRSAAASAVDRRCLAAAAAGYSARLVNMRYGSSTPRVTRSSISTPM